MNFSINRTKFYNALSVVSRAVSPNSPVPALSGIKIEAESDRLVLTGSDANLSIQETLSPALDQDLNLSVVEEGTIVVESRYLMDIVKKLDSDVITIEIIDGTLIRFLGTKAEFKINGIRPEDYPNLNFDTAGITFTLANNVFSSMIAETSFAASIKETRPVLTGVNLSEKEGVLTVTATDSYRLARKSIPVSADAFTITVPAKSLNEARSIFTEKDIAVTVTNKMIQMQSGSIILQSTLLEGGYPETDRLIPTEFTRTLIINRQALLSAIDRTSFIRTDNMPVIRLQLNSTDDITISNKNQEIGESHEELTAESFEGEPLDISFAGNYVSDAARALSTENIKVQFTAEMKPFILTNEGGDETILQLVLPVRTYN